MKTLNDCIVPDEEDIKAIISYVKSIDLDDESHVKGLESCLRNIIRGNMCQAVSNYIEYSKQD